jgi:hypothetical protein
VRGDNGTMSEAEQRVTQSGRRDDASLAWLILVAMLIVFAVLGWRGYAAG